MQIQLRGEDRSVCLQKKGQLSQTKSAVNDEQIPVNCNTFLRSWTGSRGKDCASPTSGTLDQDFEGARRTSTILASPCSSTTSHFLTPATVNCRLHWTDKVRVWSMHYLKVRHRGTAVVEEQACRQLRRCKNTCQRCLGRLERLLSLLCLPAQSSAQRWPGPSAGPCWACPEGCPPPPNLAASPAAARVCLCPPHSL